MKIGNKSYLIILIVILAPVIINFLIKIPDFGYLVGDSSTWVGFFGNYSGGIIGGIVAYIIANFQYKKEKETKEVELKKTKEVIKYHIETLIYPEIKMNLNLFYEKNDTYGLSRSLKEMFDEFLDSLTYNYSTGKKMNFTIIEFKEFKTMVFSRSMFIEKEILEIYRVFKLLDGKDGIYQLSYLDAKFAKETFEKWEKKLNN
ncbi:hypothetical protein J5Y03_12275 [Bacillus sp. RG28]|uniref:Uncharacterized protein n=1 Tax=Gottfriedia endophytica TaxID=2820819 RepID=A0A940NQZ1_9BACI|nr:hypothetical protein [Gottfriedia endophytica]MBP0725948.1 hypothetical protein [Gottfriedia endophytica]